MTITAPRTDLASPGSSRFEISQPPVAERPPRLKVAIYALTDCDPEMKYYRREVSRVIGVLRGALKDLHRLREDYRTKN